MPIYSNLIDILITGQYFLEAAKIIKKGFIEIINFYTFNSIPRRRFLHTVNKKIFLLVNTDKILAI
jgi:hypothetical protein